MVFTPDQLVEIIRLTYQDKRSSRYIAELMGCGKSTVSDFLRKETYKDFWEAHDEKPVATGTLSAPDVGRKKLKGQRFVFTSAQNNTFVHGGFLRALENYCEHNDAELIVGTFHYNKNAYQKGDDQDESCWFDPKIREYVLDESREVAPGLLWCGELDIIPTAANPLSGFHSYTKSASGIIPHVKVQMESLPVPKACDPRMIYTTGTVTLRNYVERKAGQLAGYHHVFGAVVAEVDEDGDWFVRQLNGESETGYFYDLGKYYKCDSVEEDNIEGIQYGDIHADKLDDVVADVSWRNKDSILDTLKPKYAFLEDLYEMSSRGHHNVKHPYYRFQAHIDGSESVEAELRKTAGVVEEMLRPFTRNIVVESNHDRHLAKWLVEEDYRYDPINAEIFLELQLETYKAIRENRDFSVFEYACKTRNEKLEEVRFLRTDESFLLCGEIECGQHGDRGSGGSRGSTKSYQKQGLKFNIGHQHSANIKDGVFVAGVSGNMDMGYNSGASTWNQSHIITYKNGKRTIVTIKNGKWRG